MAHKKGVGSSKNGRESAAQRLGIKIFGGQKVVAGNIIVLATRALCRSFPRLKPNKHLNYSKQTQTSQFSTESWDFCFWNVEC